jgi:hypothetical protein
MSDVVILKAGREDVGKASEAGGIGGTGGVVCTIRFDGADASVFFRKDASR